jgi:hypothetical protein
MLRVSTLRRLPPLVLMTVCPVFVTAADSPVSFTDDVRPILSNKCFACHGPDDAERQGGVDGLRFDTPEGAFADLGDGSRAIVPGSPEQSRLIERITSTDPDARMPPADFGKPLTPEEIETLRRWIADGAEFAPHWSYVIPARPTVPDVAHFDWSRTPVDRFLLQRLESEGLSPAAPADRAALIRRVTLDLTGLPPTIAEVNAFLADDSPDAYERLVDQLLASPAYGEHFARMWLDLARYADSAGYADDPARTIWGYRDWVIRAFNRNQPFDEFTVDQLAGDLLPEATLEQRIATAFHRNTLTNNEGGTNDEEFRTVAVVDRVNTTLAVWMGTTMACAQCHTHKYDPITQQEYFQFYAILNNTDDADRGNEAPLVEIYTADQRHEESQLRQTVAALEERLRTPTPELDAAQHDWQSRLAAELPWSTLRPTTVASSDGTQLTVSEGAEIVAATPAKQDSYTVEIPISEPTRLTGLRLTSLPDAALPGGGAGHGGGNFVVTKVSATLNPPEGTRLPGRFVRVELPGQGVFLSLAEVQVFSNGVNLALAGAASQVSTDYGGDAPRAIDGNTNGLYNEAQSTSHTAAENDPWWEVDLGSQQPIDQIVVWNRTDNGVSGRLKDFRVSLLDADRNVVWQTSVAEPPNPSHDFAISGVRSIPFVSAGADYTQPQFDPAAVIAETPRDNAGWAVGGDAATPHALTLIPAAPVEIPAGTTLSLRIEQRSQWEQHLLGRFQISVTSDDRAADWASIPADVAAILRTPDAERDDAKQSRLRDYYRTIAPLLAPVRDELATTQKQLAEFKPATTVPVMLELATGSRRETRLQHRGNFLDLGDVVSPGIPAAFGAPAHDGELDRLEMARWLVSRENPLTARVIVNRYWEKIFGVGLVRTSEEFGSQGELPSHPELLDWLAVEFLESGWDLHHLLRLMVLSSAYRQSSAVTPDLYSRDPDNRLLARGPRFRLTAEMVRDQSLAAAGLLSDTLYGPPVRPPQPSQGLSAAFGSSTDWETSQGDDRYRRALYIQWRRSNPYPSMTAFDAPNREVCTLRRDRTNTPLQAFVTLNDPVYVEAAQALGRQVAAHSGTTTERLAYGFELTLSRLPTPAEASRLEALYNESVTRFSANPAQAEKFATDPIGPLPAGSDSAQLAAWTLVGNVLLNLDEMLMKR